MSVHVTFAEVAPAAPLLPILAELMGYVVAFGLCVMAIYVVRAFFGTAESLVGWIPWLGSKLKGPLRAIEQKLTNELGQAVAGLDHRMALTWYKLAHTAEWIGREVAANAYMLLDLAKLVSNPLSLDTWRAVLHDLHTGIDSVLHRIGGSVALGLRPLTARVTVLERWAHSQVTVLRHAIDVTIPRDIAGLRGRTRTVERELEAAWAKIKAHEKLLGIGALTGVVAVILSRLGLGWARCNNVGKVGKNLCGMNASLLESLLADTLLIAGTLSLVEFAREMVGVTDTAVRPITTFWRAS